MRYASKLLVALLSATTLVKARAFPELLGRSTSDVCANVDAELVVTDPKHHIPVNAGLIKLCFCLSDIPSLVNTHPAAIHAGLIAGTNAVKAALQALVNQAKDHKSCTYPEFSEPLCSASDPCAFHCKSGFTPSPPVHSTECICKLPNRVCNGVCGFFPGHLCPSGFPKKRELELELQYKRATCEKGFSACGVYDSNSAEAWECVDTTTDLESCGGCMVPFGHMPALGVDCTAIPGVMDVSCAASSCIVHRCLPGWVISQDMSFCVRKGELVLAAEYGLEHVPLKREPSA